MLKISKFVASTKRVKFLRSSDSYIFTTSNAEDFESENVEDLWSNYNPLLLRVKSPSHICNNWDEF